MKLTDFVSVVSSFSFPLSCVCNLNSVLLLASFVFHLKNIFTIYHSFHSFIPSFTHSFIPVACAEYDDSLPFSGTSSIPLCYILFIATHLCQLFFHPVSLHLAIYFFDIPLNLLVPKFIYNTLLGILFSSILCT